MKPNLDQDRNFGAELDSNDAGELVIPAVVEVFNLVTSAIPVIGGITSTAYSTWQVKQQQKFAATVKQLFRTLNDRKLDKEYVNSDEFMELVNKVVEGAIKTGSERKQLALAGALTNSCTPSGSKVPGKFFLLNTLLSMSEDDIAVLEAMQNEHGFFRQYEHAIAAELEWQVEKVQAICEELECQGILSSNTNFGDWAVTSRGMRLIEWCAGIEQVGNLGSLRTSLKQEIASDITRDLVNTFNRAAMQARGL